MGRIVRKNLMVDEDALRELAKERGTSESQAVRYAVDRALGAQEMLAALKELHDLGAFADFEELFGEPETPLVADESYGSLRMRRPVENT